MIPRHIVAKNMGLTVKQVRLLETTALLKCRAALHRQGLTLQDLLDITQIRDAQPKKNETKKK